MFKKALSALFSLSVFFGMQYIKRTANNDLNTMMSKLQDKEKMKKLSAAFQTIQKNKKQKKVAKKKPKLSPLEQKIQEFYASSDTKKFEPFFIDNLGEYEDYLRNNFFKIKGKWAFDKKMKLLQLALDIRGDDQLISELAITLSKRRLAANLRKHKQGKGWVQEEILMPYEIYLEVAFDGDEALRNSVDLAKGSQNKKLGQEILNRFNYYYPNYADELYNKIQ